MWDLKPLISEGKAADLILMQEALQEKTIGNIARARRQRPGTRGW